MSAASHSVECRQPCLRSRCNTCVPCSHANQTWLEARVLDPFQALNHKDFPSQVMRRLGMAKDDEVWLISKALYGLTALECEQGSYVTDINHESHFAWQVQYLVTLQDETCCSAHCK